WPGSSRDDLKIDVGVVRPLAGIRASSHQLLEEPSARQVRVAGSALLVETRLPFCERKSVKGHDSGFGFVRTVQNVYITDPLRVKIDPLLNHLTLRPEIVHVVRLAPHPLTGFSRRHPRKTSRPARLCPALRGPSPPVWSGENPLILDPSIISTPE